MVFAMAIIGAITRLTESGLSITEWKPIMGAIPPLTEAAWQHEFNLYKQTSEFRIQHYWMELDDFKNIYFWEWFHRLWGRAIGLVYALPLLYFFIRKQIPKGYGTKFVGLLALGGLQGVIGWWMVTSGLVDRADVSHYRLAIHLGMAILLFCLLFWLAMNLKYEKRVSDLPVFCVRRHGWTSLALLSITILWGAFVAGSNAGVIYNTWPLMGGQITPPETFNISSIIEKQAWLQFIHRWIAIVAGGLILSFAYRVKAWPLALMVIAQIGLGIATLLTGVHIHVAATHQAGAIILTALLLSQLHRFYYVHR